MNYIKTIFGTINSDYYNQNQKSLLLNTIKNSQKKVLTKIGIETGFINDDLRIKAYSLLLKFHPNSFSEKFRRFKNNIDKNPKKIILKEKFSRIIDADVNRSLNSNELVFEKKIRYKIIHRKNLENVLTYFFLKYQNLSYYQGFNSVAEIFTLYYGEDLGFCVLDRFANLFLKNFLDEKKFDFEINKKQKFIINLVFWKSGILLEELHLGILLGWTLTFFSHNLKDKEKTLRIWDFLICLKIEEIEKGVQNDGNCVEILVGYIILEFIEIFKVTEIEFKKNGFMILKKFDLDVFEDEHFENVFKNSYDEFLKKFLKK